MKNSLRLLRLSILLAFTTHLCGCQAQQEPTVAINGQEAEVLDFAVALDLGDLNEQEARIIISERAASTERPSKGVSFGWSKGEVIENVYVRFRQGTKSAVSKGTLTILEHKPEDKAYKGKLSVTAPSGFDLSPRGNSFVGGDIYVSAALGVDNVTPAGIITVNPKEVYEEKKSGANLPMCATESKVSFTRNDESGVPVYGGLEEFRLLGSLFRFVIDNKSNMSYYPIKLSIREGMLDGAALFNITDGKRSTGFPPSVIKGINISFGERSVPARAKQTFYIWAYAQPKLGTADAFLYNTYSWPTPDVKTKLRFTAIPENHKVYNLPLRVVPKSGDLIFTEVLIRGNVDVVENAFELYNPTDFPINLNQYSVRKVSTDKTNNPTTGLTSGVTRWRKLYGSDNNMLPPRKSILIIGNSQTVGAEPTRDLWNASKRPGIHYASRYDPQGYYVGAKYNAFQAINVANRYTTSWQIIKGGKVIDEIFGGMGIPKSVTIMRKPGRNLPRTKMQMGNDTDWVTRQAKEQYDWGFRFSYIYDRTRVGKNFHSARWLLDTDGSTEYGQYTDNSVVGFLNRSPLLLRTSYNWGDNFESGRDAAPYYEPPFWWTRSRAEAADR